jgi:hypothetical protein
MATPSPACEKSSSLPLRRAARRRARSCRPAAFWLLLLLCLPGLLVSPEPGDAWADAPCESSADPDRDDAGDAEPLPEPACVDPETRSAPRSEAAGAALPSPARVRTAELRAAGPPPPLPAGDPTTIALRV